MISILYFEVMELFILFLMIGFVLIFGGRSVGRSIGGALIQDKKPPAPTYIDNSTTIHHHHHHHNHQNISIIDDVTKKKILELKK